MLIENIQTTKQYNVSEEDWKKLGKHQKAFKIISKVDALEQKGELIKPTVPPVGKETGKPKNKK
jgi:hypothetical protein